MLKFESVADNIDPGVEKTGEETAVEKGKEEQSKTSEEKIAALSGTIAGKTESINKLAGSVGKTATELADIRKEMGLPQPAEEPKELQGRKEELEKLEAEKERLEKEKKELMREAKKEILQERVSNLFKEFEKMGAQALEALAQTGKTESGENMESGSMGSIDPETAKGLAKAFSEGLKFLPQILKALPGLMESFDAELTKEAEARAEKTMAEKEKEAKDEESPAEDAEKSAEGGAGETANIDKTSV